MAQVDLVADLIRQGIRRKEFRKIELKGMPSKNKPQVQGYLWIDPCEWIDYCSYYSNYNRNYEHNIDDGNDPIPDGDETTPIDRFVGDRLKSEGLSPAEPSEPRARPKAANGNRVMKSSLRSSVVSITVTP